MNEIKRAIQYFKENIEYLRKYNADSETMKINKTALMALCAEQARKEKKPKCGSCKNIGKSWACDNCTEDKALTYRTSYYEAK